MGVIEGGRFLFSLARCAVRAVRDEVRGRRVWARDGRAHIEARQVDHIDAPAAYVAALERAVAALEGVHWAVVNGVLGDVIVDFDSGATSVSELCRAVERVEREYGISGHRRDRPKHPGDSRPVLGGLVELAGDLLGIAGGVAGRAVPGLSIPPETMALPAAFDLLPELRHELATRFGANRVDLALSLATSVLGAAAQTPFSSLADAALRAVQLPAALARCQTWEQRAGELTASRPRARAAPQQPSPEPATPPDGPAERYTRKARLATGLAAATLLPLGGVRKAARAVAIGAPKAAGMGSAAYAAELGRVLAARGVGTGRMTSCSTDSGDFPRSPSSTSRFHLPWPPGSGSHHTVHTRCSG